MTSHAEGFQAVCEDQQLHAIFKRDWVEIDSAALPSAWGLTLRCWGYGEALWTLPSAEPIAAGNCVEYRRGSLTEWYLNGPLGLEQGFTLQAPPDERLDGEPLVMELAFHGDFHLTLSSDQQQIALQSGTGHGVMHYGHLFPATLTGSRYLFTSNYHLGRRPLFVS